MPLVNHDPSVGSTPFPVAVLTGFLGAGIAPQLLQQHKQTTQPQNDH